MLFSKLIQWLKERKRSLNQKGWYYLFRNKKYIIEQVKEWEHGYEPIYKTIPKLEKQYKEIQGLFIKEVSKYGEIEKLNLSRYHNTVCLWYSYKDKPTFEYTLQIQFVDEDEFIINASYGDYAYSYINNDKVEKYREDLKNDKWLVIKKKLFTWIMYGRYRLPSKIRRNMFYKLLEWSNKSGVNGFKSIFELNKIKKAQCDVSPCKFSYLHCSLLRQQKFNYKEIDNLKSDFLNAIIGFYKMSLLEADDFNNFKNSDFFDAYKNKSKYFHKLNMFDRLEFDKNAYLELMDIIRSTNYKCNEDTEALIKMVFQK